jgi:ferredoxin
MRRFIYIRDVTTLRLDPEKCVGCGMCLEVCPHEVFMKTNGRVSVTERDACMECGACMINCPTGAVTVSAGVGCAAAVINSALGRTSSSCCCVIERKSAGSASWGDGPALSNPGCC